VIVPGVGFLLGLPTGGAKTDVVEDDDEDDEEEDDE
jgi:hypothetical protein